MHFNSDLITVAQHINWYRPAEELLNNQPLFLCQVMARGHTDDVVKTMEYFSKDDFVIAYQNAPPGLFDQRAWAYWGVYLLGESLLPFPVRKMGSTNFNWRQKT